MKIKNINFKLMKIAFVAMVIISQQTFAKNTYAQVDILCSKISSASKWIKVGLTKGPDDKWNALVVTGGPKQKSRLVGKYVGLEQVELESKTEEAEETVDIHFLQRIKKEKFRMIIRNLHNLENESVSARFYIKTYLPKDEVDKREYLGLRCQNGGKLIFDSK